MTPSASNEATAITIRLKGWKAVVVIVVFALGWIALAYHRYNQVHEHLKEADERIRLWIVAICLAACSVSL